MSSSTTVKWIKLDINIFNDEKIKQIKAMPDGDTMVLIWIQLLCLAGKSNSDGFIFLTNEIPYTDSMMCTEFGCSQIQLDLALGMFERFGMLEIIEDIYHVSNWRKYQSEDRLETIRRKDRERKAKHSVIASMQNLSLPAETTAQPKEQSDISETDKKGKPRKKYGQYGWVRLTDDEYDRLGKELGEQERDRCITYIDEQAQSNGNKNKWKDWNLVIRRCSREKWGYRYGMAPAVPQQRVDDDHENWDD